MPWLPSKVANTSHTLHPWKPGTRLTQLPWGRGEVSASGSRQPKLFVLFFACSHTALVPSEFYLPSFLIIHSHLRPQQLCKYGLHFAPGTLVPLPHGSNSLLSLSNRRISSLTDLSFIITKL